VWISSKKAVFLVTGEPRESKYSYSVPIIPIHGLYYSSKEKRRYTAKELGDYYTILNIDKDDANAIKGKTIVVIGYTENETLFVPADAKEGDVSNDDTKA